MAGKRKVQALLSASQQRRSSEEQGDGRQQKQVRGEKHEGRATKKKRRKEMQQEAQALEAHAALESPRLQPEIRFTDDGAVVVLAPGQHVLFDGAAKMRLLRGSASVLGFGLLKGQDQYVISNCQLSSCLAVEHADSQHELPPSEGGSDPQDVHEASMRPVPSSSEQPRAKNGGARGRANKVHEPPVNIGGVLVREGEAVVEVKERAGAAGTVEAGQRWSFHLEVETPASVQTINPSSQREQDIAHAQTALHENGGAAASMDNALADQAGERLASDLGAVTTVIPRLWREVSAEVTAWGTTQGQGHPPIVAICGGKNVGKSTYARFLTNSLLNRYKQVAFLETDAGQPEFTPPGLLSLHIIDRPVFGPPSMHLRPPHRAFFYGDVSPKSDPSFYLRCVVSLYDYFRRHFYDAREGSEQQTPLPLVINTHGWVKGLGLDVVIDLLRYTVPTFVVRVQSASLNKNLPDGAFWEAAATATEASVLRFVPSATPEARKAPRSAPEERALRLLSYLRPAVGLLGPEPYPYSEADTYAAVAEALAYHRPYQVPLGAVSICHLHAQVPAHESLRALNGAVVGLAASSAKAGEELPGPLCLGLGLVRGIDTAKGVLHVLTPVPLEDLQQVDTVLQGRTEVPLQLLQAMPLACPYLTYNSIAAEGTGSATIRSRNNLLRKGGEAA